MSSFFEDIISKQTLHHAYLIEGPLLEVRSELTDFLKKIDTAEKPEIISFEYAQFGIDDSREIKFHQSERGGTGSTYILVSTLGFTRESQNAMLKVLEEPRPSVHIFIITPHIDELLDTLKSRTQILRYGKGDESSKGISVSEFLDASISKRLSLIKDFIATYEDEDSPQTLRHEAGVFFRELEEYIEKQISGKNYSVVSAGKELVGVQQYLFDRSASVKMILEHIACTFPVK